MKKTDTIWPEPLTDSVIKNLREYLKKYFTNTPNADKFRKILYQGKIQQMTKIKDTL